MIVAMNRPSLDKFEAHVKPGGVLVINSSIIDRKAVRDDITVVYCDANGIAESIGNPKGANVAILGATLAKAPVTSVESMMEAIRIELGEKKARFLEGKSLIHSYIILAPGIHMVAGGFLLFATIFTEWFIKKKRPVKKVSFTEKNY